MRSTAIWTTMVAIGVMGGTDRVWAGGGPEQGRARLAAAAPSSSTAGQRYDEPTGLWITNEVDSSGDTVIHAKGNSFSVRKSMKRGTVTLAIQAGRDTLNLGISGTQITVTSGKRTVRFDPTRATEQHYHAVKQLLAASKVVARLRLAAASLSPATVASPEGVSFLLTEALVALLDGDSSAVDRLKARARAERIGTGVRKARAATNTCWEQYVSEAYDAMIDAERCVNDFEVWNVVMRNLCYLHWTLRAESAWFQFVGCTMGSGIRLT
jgi:hypothetical protein